MAFNLFQKQKVKKEKMSIVGYLDFTEAQKIQKELHENEQLKKQGTVIKYECGKKNDSFFSFSDAWNKFLGKRTRA